MLSVRTAWKTVHGHSDNQDPNIYQKLKLHTAIFFILTGNHMTM